VTNEGHFESVDPSIQLHDPAVILVPVDLPLAVGAVKRESPVVELLQFFHASDPSQAT
jgi:hypothetical protein